MEVEVRFVEGVKFEVNARGHRVMCDQPLDNGGEDVGFSPPEFLLASLGTCAAYYASQYLKARGLDCKGLAVNVAAEKAQRPARLSSFCIEIVVPELPERHHDPLLRAAKSCLIHNTLLRQPAIEVAIRTVERDFRPTAGHIPGSRPGVHAVLQF